MRTFFLIFFVLFVYLLHAQDITTDETPVLFRKETAWGAMVHTQGLGINYRNGKHKTAALKRFYEFEFVSIRHPKEIKIINPYFEDAKSFKYGKLNYASALRVSFGRHKTLNFKPYWGGVEVRYLFNLGFSAAILKPVYLSILYPTDIPYSYTISDEKYDPEKHNSDLIYGRASFFRGFNELKFYPGVYSKLGLSFEYGSKQDVVRSLDLGIAVDAYLKSVPIMAFDKNNNYFLTLFLSLHFGGREYY
ncbi:MAG: hypothetical protein PHT69_03250 [Bacteroidales bacterium]|nr:hypothetical protein [Bacteroidales bacterium]